MSTLLPYDSSEGSVTVTQAIHDFFPGGSYSSLLYYSYDFDLEKNDQVLSIADGVVVGVVNFVVDGTEMAGSNNTDTYPQYGPGGTGNQITIYYDDLDLYVTYAHLEQGSIPFIEGDTVSQGDVIGEIGYTGVAIPTSFDHLHITYGTDTTTWGSSTSDFYLGTTLIADGSTAQNGLPSTVPNGQPTSAALVFDESGVPLLEGANAPVSQNFANLVDRERSFNEALVENTVANSLDELTQFYLEANLAPNVSNVSFTGSGDAAFFVENLVGDIGLSGFADLDGGILLSTGGYPGPSNTTSSFTVAHGTSGDSDLDQVLEDAGFTGAGTTQDAVSIEFTINVTPGSDVDGISFDIVFGSEEYPEFSSSSFVDVAAIFVNGDNYALFNDDPTTPLSVLDDNVFSGNFIDNDISPFPSIYPIEWDGFSNVLTVRAPLQSGQNTIKIAIADTGDQSYDSGLYIQDMDLLYDGGTSGGVLTVVNASISGGDLFLTGLLEEVNLFDGQDTVKAIAANFNGDIITGFAQGDQLVFLGSTFTKDDVTITSGSAILNIDSDQNGSVDTVVTLAGDFTAANFGFENIGPDTIVTVSYNAPPLAKDDSFSVDEDQTLVGNVLDDNGNGIDSDPDGDALTVSLISGPSEGSLILNDDGSFTYDADADVFDLAAPGDVIDQTFTYQIDDGNGETGQATVTISVSIQDDGQTIVGTNKEDSLNGTDGGEDIIYGDNAKDTIYGLDGADTIYGGNADDMLFGGESVDNLFGENGDDQLYGEQGEDYLDGGRGNDVLRGGLDDDTLLGGRGDDVFVLALGEGTDTVLDYGVGDDLIGLVGLTFEDLTIGQSGDDATISSGGEVLAVLIGVDALTLDEADVFNFV